MSKAQVKYVDVLTQFRHNLEMTKQHNIDMLEAPEAVKSLFQEFLEMTDTNVNDIMALLLLVANTDKGDWDSIAHEFL